MTEGTMYLLFFIIGLAAGGLLGWILAGSRLRSLYETTATGAKERAAAADASAGELRQQLLVRDDQINVLRAQLAEEQKAHASAETALRAEHEKLLEEQKLLDQAREKLADVFKALASDVLKGESQSFITLAQEAFRKLRAEAEGDLGKRQEAIQGLVEPLKKALNDLESQVQLIEDKRQKAYGGLEEQLRTLATTSQDLQRQTGNLTATLRGMPQVRGRWGEQTLHRAVELAGMVEHVDFVEQSSTSTEEGRLRPDMLINLPAGRTVVVDAKVSLVAYHEAVEAESEEKRQEALHRHAASVRDHLNKLSSKRYWEQFEPAPDFVVFFLPGEAFFSAAVQYDRTLIEEGIEKGVILASPTTLIALLRAIAYGWRQEQMTQNAQEVSRLGKDLYDRLRKLGEHFMNLRSALEHAIEAYNGAVGSMEARVMPAARRFRELGTTGGEEIDPLEPVDKTPRTLSLPQTNDHE